MTAPGTPCDCGQVTLPVGAHGIWVNDTAHAEPLCLPMPAGAKS